jgi:hypothetical protein
MHVICVLDMPEVLQWVLRSIIAVEIQMWCMQSAIEDGKIAIMIWD